MKNKVFLALSLSVSVLLPALAQTRPSDPVQQKATTPAKDDDVVRITTNLVQIDAVVTKNGKVVPNLTADDFEIYEDGRQQTITSFAYVSNVSRSVPETGASRESGTNPIPFSPFKREQPHRTMALVVDDLGLSAESMNQVRRQLRKFIAEELHPNDLVAVMRTSGELGVLQQFTTDRRLLNRAVDQLRWNFCSRVGIHVFTPARSAGTTTCSLASSRATLASLRFIIDSMGRLPGRKSLVLLTDDLPRQSQDDLLGDGGLELAGEDNNAPQDAQLPDIPYSNYTEALNKLAERAIRASVVIYSVDTQSLAITGITAADHLPGDYRTITQRINSILSTRSSLLLTRREGSLLLARQTGGFQIHNSNSFKLDTILEDQSGYYLIGYRPSDETFNRRFHHIRAKVKRSGMSLRTRYGFFGLTEEEVAQRQLTTADLTNLALASPFTAQEIELYVTPFFADYGNDRALIRSFVDLNLRDLAFTVVNGERQASIDVHSVVFGDNGRLVQQLQHVATLRFTEIEYERALSNGFPLSVDLPVKRPGSYQVRVAIRDRTSAKLGSGGGFVSVPNVKTGQLATSGIILGTMPKTTTQTDAANEVMINPGTRRFKAGSDLKFVYRIYNAAVGGGKLRDLSVETLLVRDSTDVLSRPVSSVVADAQKDLDHVIVNGVAPLSGLEPGNYYLQVVITEQVAKKKVLPVVQWAEFEIVK